jgi:hypothetical protein
MILTNKAVLEAMSVVPISWLTAAEIVAEMFIEADGRAIVPILKSLIAQGCIISSADETSYDIVPEKGPYTKPTYYRLSDDEIEKVVKAYEALEPSE